MWWKGKSKLGEEGTTNEPRVELDWNEGSLSAKRRRAGDGSQASLVGYGNCDQISYALWEVGKPRHWG